MKSAGLREQDYLLAQDHQCRNRTDLEIRRELLFLVGIDLAEYNLRIFLGSSIENRCKRAARRSPRCPEIHNHHRVAGDSQLEIVFGKFNGGHLGFFQKSFTDELFFRPD